MTATTPVVQHTTAEVNGIRVHWAEAGEGPPVVLLHGFPETWYAWRHQIPALAERYRVLVPDLRGYGDTAKPAAGYDKRTMAGDLAALLAHLGIPRIALVGHDRGARVATRFAKDSPQLLDRLAVLDNVPTRIIAQRLSAQTVAAQWFFVFNRVPNLPEALIAGREELWLRHFFSTWCTDPTTITDHDVAVYARAFAQPGAVRGAMEDYRAMEEDVAQDEEDADAPIEVPVLALWGADFDGVGRMYDVLDVWRGMARDVRGVEIPRCGHLPHEEQPAAVTAELHGFLDGWAG
jgi:pimeloyl-ACP methyl ester carboxylesterase